MSVNDTLAERGSRYGAFADHAVIAQGIQDVMREAPKWDHLDPDMKQALSVIADKIARILNGDPFYVDNWHDICGYSLLIENRINMIVDSGPDCLYPEEPSENPDASWVNPNVTAQVLPNGPPGILRNTTLDANWIGAD